MEAFEKVKKMLADPEFFIHYDPALPIVVHCDASLYGLGRVLSHILADGCERQISFGSQTLSPAERGYGQIEKEGLAIIYSIKKFHQWVPF